ncbi:imidazoleglycerol-phosphate dehydratase HisB [Aliifodinibius sp. S!AR15-10]|uniref:imidazoleglycerol-phosphate dehydratase HisB n=1 Tax=Aliifodinibius sp. S!AR15-10 TaxID=2950437 RepID=UPI00286554AD|nr:imidazoleglycerol-phosphate dehydratase HisB [Aliifodinibius sp. S!AR15-10]MDR8394472.1 imidazoleglycerol-phosphate dehydratase HisB [Aliifodinibius sp. S!AR15-10]
MKIWVHYEALGKDRENLLWPGALFGLNYLQKLDHEVGFQLKELTDTQNRLLSNERIEPQFNTPDEADLFVFAEDGTTLQAETSDDVIATSDDWLKLAHELCFPQRKAELSRKTAETDINIAVNLDGTGQAEIDTGLKFYDHMLEQIAKHGLIDLEIKCTGDLEVDEHHTIEDVAIALGETITEALGNKMGIQRYSFVLPMDESNAQVSLDLSGRPYVVFEADFKREMVGDFPTEMTEHFFYSLAMHLKATLHISVSGSNDHHKIEACFKGLARCLRASVSRSERQYNILPSTKNLL